MVNRSTSDEISSKLKIFSTVYVVVSRQGNNYTIRDAISGKETVAHVSQIARMRSPVGPEESEEVPALTQNDEQVWDRLKEGTYCIIWLKTEDGGEVYSPCSPVAIPGIVVPGF